MRICHVTSHLPPDQAANALLPMHLGEWARAAGDTCVFVAQPPRAIGLATATALAGIQRTLPGDVVWFEPRRPSWRVPVVSHAASLADAIRLWRVAGAALRAADVVHVHSNGLLPEAASLLASWLRVPVVLTLYGTEIWHYRRRKVGVDLFARAYRSAAQVTFYSQGLLDRALEHGLTRAGLSVVYPPVAGYFTPAGDATRQQARETLGLRERHVLVNVTRLHPLAGQRYLIEAMPAVLGLHPDTRLVFCGTGPLRSELEDLVGALGIADHVTFAGLLDNRMVASYYAAADLFVLPSLLEACPTVAIEALASGTPVVSTDNPGGVELQRLFGGDVRIVPRENPGALSAAISLFLNNPQRARPGTGETIAREFAPAIVARRFADVYRLAAPGASLD